MASLLSLCGCVPYRSFLSISISVRYLNPASSSPLKSLRCTFPADTAPCIYFHRYQRVTLMVLLSWWWWRRRQFVRVMLSMGSDLGFFSVVWGILILAFSSALLGAGIRDGVRDYQEINASVTDSFVEHPHLPSADFCSQQSSTIVAGAAAASGSRAPGTGTGGSAGTTTGGGEAPMTSWAGW